MLRIVSATRHTESRFTRDALLRRSLPTLHDQKLIIPTIRFANSGTGVKGLSTVYNEAIDKSGRDETLIFHHEHVAFGCRDLRRVRHRLAWIADIVVGFIAARRRKRQPAAALQV